MACAETTKVFLISPVISKTIPSIPQTSPPNHTPLKEYTSDSYADWLASYITSNNIEKPILIGHSFGSIVSAAIAAKYPNLLNDKVILIAPISEKPAKFFGKIIPTLSLLPDKFLDYVITRFLFIPNDSDLFEYSLKFTALSRQNICSKLDLIKCARFCSEHAVSDYKFNKNLLIIAGKSDRLNPLAKTKRIASEHNAILKIVPRSGHLINFEEPDTVAAEIKNFI